MRLPALLLLAALALSGCFGGDNDGAADDGSGDGADVPDGGTGTPDDGQDGGDPTDPGDAGDDAENQTAPRDPVTWHVTIQGNDFVEGSLTVQAGDRVVWTLQDGSHTVTSDDGAFDSGTMSAVSNSEFSHTFSEVGEFPYHCILHSNMREAVTVLERYDEMP